MPIHGVIHGVDLCQHPEDSWSIMNPLPFPFLPPPPPPPPLLSGMAPQLSVLDREIALLKASLEKGKGWSSHLQTYPHTWTYTGSAVPHPLRLDQELRRLRDELHVGDAPSKGERCGLGHGQQSVTPTCL